MSHGRLWVPTSYSRLLTLEPSIAAEKMLEEEDYKRKNEGDNKVYTFTVRTYIYIYIYIYI